MVPYFKPQRLCADSLAGGPRSIIPGGLIVALFGVGGQSLYDLADARHTAAKTNDSTEGRSWLDSKWSPVKLLTDDEYEKMLQEKLLRVNAEIALVEESIEKLRAEATPLKADPKE